MGFSFGCISSLELVVALVRPLWVAALSRIIICVAEDLMGRLANLLHSIGVYLVTLVIGSSLCARGLDRDSFESSETRVWLGKPTRIWTFVIFFFIIIIVDILVLALVEYVGRILVGRDHIWSRQWILVLRSC